MRVPLDPTFLTNPSQTRPRSCVRHETGLPRRTVDEGRCAATDVDPVGLAEIDELEADTALRLLAADRLPEVEPPRVDLGQILHALDGRAPDAEDLEEGAAGARGEREHTCEHDRAGSRGRARAGARANVRPRRPASVELERRRLGPRDLVAQRAEAELELRHGSPPSAPAAVRARVTFAT